MIMVKLFFVVVVVALFQLVQAVSSLHKRDRIATIVNQHHVDESLIANKENDYGFGHYNLRLIQTSELGEAEWLTEDEVFDLIRAGIKFMDITDHLELGESLRIKKSYAFPVHPAYEDEVFPFIEDLTTKYMEANLKKFTSFRNRYYRSDSGKESSEWLYSQIRKIVKDADNDVNVSVRKFKHHWEQRSIIARFEGSNKDLDNEVVIIGAHQDSINMWYWALPAPGADDDGSGTVTILEAFRVLVKGGFKPVRPVEFHWYSAEEAGLLGSQDIASYYEKQHKDVIAMLQNDMTGFVAKNKPESFGIITDYVDTGLTNFAKSLIDTYAAIPWRDTKCGYACSDHASWRKAGYPSAFAIESEFHDSNPYIHSTQDVVENLSFDHMLEFSKLAVSFAVELSHI